VHFTAPLRSNGAVDSSAAPGAGTNWPSALLNPASLEMPPGRYVGNASGLVITQQLVLPRVAAYPRPGQARGGPIVQSIAATVTLYGLGAANMADYLSGVWSESVGRTVTNRIFAGGARLVSDSMLFTAEPIDLSQPVQVIPSWASWIEGEHWTADAFGVRLMKGFSAPLGAYVDISYRSASGVDVVEGLIRPSRTLGIVYHGVNAVSSRHVRADIYRAQLNPVQAADLLSDGISVVNLNFNIEPVLAPLQVRPRWYRIMSANYA